MSDQDENQLSEALATELVALLEGMEQERQRAREERQEWQKAWERENEEWNRTRTWYANQAADQRRLLSDLREAMRGQDVATAALTRRLEHQHAPWWGWSRDRWKVVLVSVGLSLTVSLGAVTLYQEFGPAGQELVRLEAQNATWQKLWAVTTEAQRAEILKQAR